MYLGLQASIATTIGPTYEMEMREKKGYVKNAKLQCTMPILLFKIILRVADGVFNVYLLHITGLQGIGTMWMVGDTIWCLKHQYTSRSYSLYNHLVISAQIDVSQLAQWSTSF
jgi:hypothetical protein